MWTVNKKKKLVKQIKKLPVGIQQKLFALIKDLNAEGPIQIQWPNFGKITGQVDIYHCHIKKGNPTYVVIWEVKDKKIKILEITYVGTHEKAPY